MDPVRAFLGIVAALVLSNPKAAVVYGGIFATLLPPSPPWWMLAALPPAAFVIDGAWYVIVALAFSAPRSRAAYLGAERWIDRAAGAIIGLLGAKLMVASRPA